MLSIKALLTKMLDFIKIDRATSGVLTAASGYTVRYQDFQKRSGFVHARFAINRGGTAFTNGRTTVGTVGNGYVPKQSVMVVAPAATSINAMLSKQARLIVMDSGSVILDNQGNTDVQEINCSVVYMVN